MSENEIQGRALLNCSAVRNLCKDYGYRVGDDAIDQLGKEVKLLVAKAIRRTIDNGRKTIKEQDI